MKKILVSGPWITQKEIDYVIDAATNAWYEKANIYHQRFEKKFAAYVGRKYALALPSCTSAIHLALLSLNIGKGDEVIVPDITWIATSAPASYVGAKVVFADVDKNTWCLSAESFEKLITAKTKVVIVVDLYGNMPEMDKILKIAKKHKIAVIEDAAEAIGSEYKGKKAGSFGDTGVFSFHGSKTLVTGEGGMLITNNKKIYHRCLFWRDHGRKSGDKKMFWNYKTAYKYKMSNLQAALGLAQLERVKQLVKRKREIFSWYQKELADVFGTTLNYEAPMTKNSCWMATVVIDKKFGLKKEKLMELMSKKGIDTRPFFYPLSILPAYKNLPQAREARKRNKISYTISPYAINLPSAFNLTKEKVKYTCDCLKAILKFKTQ